ncbi:YgaP-like transmembrane domain [Sphingomonas sp.]|uniref:YgaP-like transmembrane domain n=1 Tax=Sphingomonas sp. TaxID=28214 RepID=UPI003CC56F7C
MLYRNNLPTWERLVRIGGAVLMAACAWHFWGRPVGTVFSVAAASAALTSVFGFCPACALAGRRLDRRAARSE